MLLPHRHLIPFDARRLPHYFADILVIGGGLAGLRAALAVPEDLDVLVVTKDKLPESNSQYAQGGIAGVLDPEDRFENHVEDTVTAGAGLCDLRIVERVVRAAPEALLELVRWGTHFDEEGQGRLALTLEGGHSHRRIVHALGDATGQEVMRAVIARARSASHIAVWEHAFTIDLLTVEGACRGALVHRPGWGPVLVWAKQTILASGGAGQIYRETTNPLVATGDGMALAYRAGAALADMEFMQFHPTVLYVAGLARFLVSEAVRGEGALLRDKHGERFMVQADPRAELAPRDIVARAIVRTMEATKHAHVFLDLTHLNPELVRRRFPGIAQVCSRYGLDLTKDWIPVRPAAHYMIGGVRVDERGRSTLRGLWACGEVTSSGLHGANRLASNSLLEGLVFGEWCGQGAAEAVRGEAKELRAALISDTFAARDEPLDLQDVRNSLQSLMGRAVGIERDRERLLGAARDVELWRRPLLGPAFTTPAGWELQNLLILSTLMIQAALRREESRGTHFRSDFPTPDERWRRRLDSAPAEFVQAEDAG
jgi:L-aspartate oxidase